MNLGKAIRLCRTQRRLNQTELAAMSEISVSYLSLLEHNKRDPNFSTVEKIADALEVPTIILTFLGASEEDRSKLGNKLCEKLSYTVLRLLGGNNER